MKDKSFIPSEDFQTAHLTKIIDKEGNLVFVQLSASLWEELESKVEPLVYQALKEQHQKAQKEYRKQTEEEFSPFEQIQTFKIEELGNDTFIKKRFKNSTEQSTKVQQYLDALQQKIAEHKPVG